MDQTRCPGCGAAFPEQAGPTHAYMTSSPACWAAFGRLLEQEYLQPLLEGVHRLSVDAYAVQHPGDPEDRRAVQSVGLHLARLMVQLKEPRSPRQTNSVMLEFAKRKHTLVPLQPPAAFSMTIADVAPFVGGPKHAERVLEWARSAWDDWGAHHEWIRNWVSAT